MNKIEDFIWFVEERESIRLKKEAGLPPPWTDDYILSNCRLCNIDRIHDRGTVRLFNFIGSLTDWEKVFYIFLYRSALSSQKFLEEMTGLWFHDFRNLRELEMKISDARKPYQVFLKKGDSIRSFLVDVVAPVAKEFNGSFSELREVSILDAAENIALLFLMWYGRKFIFLSTEIAKDLSHFFPEQINPQSECRMNIGARNALKKLPGVNIEDLLNSTTPNFSTVEHGLCEWGKYLSRKRYYEEHGELKSAWLYHQSL